GFDQSSAKPTQAGPRQQGLYERIAVAPGAAVRSAIQGKGYMNGFNNPEGVPKFQDMALAKFGGTDSVANMAPAIAGAAADTLTNPFDDLLMLAAPGATKMARNLSGLVKIEGRLQKAGRAKEALDLLRNKLGEAKSIAISKVAETPTALSTNGLSDKVVKAIQNPIYGVEFEQTGGLKQTVGNLDKVKEAVGELIHTDKVWEEAPNK